MALVALDVPSLAFGISVIIIVFAVIAITSPRFNAATGILDWSSGTFSTETGSWFSSVTASVWAFTFKSFAALNFFFAVWILDGFFHALALESLTIWAFSLTGWVFLEWTVFGLTLSWSWAPLIATASRSATCFGLNNVRVFSVSIASILSALIPLVGTPSSKAIFGNITDTWFAGIVVPVEGLSVLDSLKNVVVVSVFTVWSWASWIAPVEFAVAFKSLFFLATSNTFLSVVSNPDIITLGLITFALVVVAWAFAFIRLAIIKKSFLNLHTNTALLSSSLLVWEPDIALGIFTFTVEASGTSGLWIFSWWLFVFLNRNKFITNSTLVGRWFETFSNAVSLLVVNASDSAVSVTHAWLAHVVLTGLIVAVEWFAEWVLLVLVDAVFWWTLAFPFEAAAFVGSFFLFVSAAIVDSAGDLSLKNSI